MDSSLQLLFEAVAVPDFWELGGISLRSVIWEGGDVALGLTLHRQDHADEAWRVRCRGVRRYRLEGGEIHGLRMEMEHAVLWPHVWPRVELFFSGRTSDADAVVGRLLEAHRQAVGDWLDFGEFFNFGAQGSLRRLLEGGFGKLAGGPEPLMARYAEVLGAAGISGSSPPARGPAWWDGERWVAETPGTLSALILGRSFVAAAEVEAERA